jgi:outer membrane protein OmpA-like peptidoglycan-associated protein
MVYHSFRSLGRYVLAACAVGLVAASLSAQTPAAPAPVSVTNPSRVDVFLGYSYFSQHGALQPAGISYSSINAGVIASGAYYANKNFGGEFIYTDHPSGVNDGVSGVSFGPIARLPYDNLTLFAHGLVGVARLGGPNTTISGLREVEPYKWGIALTAGGGIDYAVPFWDNRFSIRVVEADYRYIHEDFGPYAGIPTSGVLGGRANLDAVEYSTGIVTHFGHVLPPPPVTYSCSVAPASVYPGDPITVTGVALNLNPKKTATYTWTTDGGAISGTTATATVDTKASAAGTYTVKGHVAEGAKPGQLADCTSQFTVKPFDPPVMTSCTANPSTVDSGGTSGITASAMSPQNRPLTYSYNASAGSIGGTTSTATLTAPTVAPGSNTSVTVTCNVADDMGHTAAASASVAVVAPAPPPPPAPSPEQVRLEARLALRSVFFPTAQPRAEHPEGGLLASQQATLTSLATDFKSYLGFKPDARLTLSGHADVRGSVEYNQALSDRRVTRVKQFLVDQGVPASSIDTRALGKDQELSSDQVKALVEQNPDLNDAERAKVIHGLKVIVLAQNRRVDVLLSTTGQQSVQIYPFNAADSKTLLDEKAGGRAKKAVTKKP